MLDPEEMSLDQLIEEVMYWRQIKAEDIDATMTEGMADYTTAEAEIIMALWNSRGRIVTRDFLQDTFLPPNSHIAERTVDSHIKRLRKKARKLGWPGEIKTVYGRGYFMERDSPHPAIRRDNDDIHLRTDRSDTSEARRNLIRSQMAERCFGRTCCERGECSR